MVCDCRPCRFLVYWKQKGGKNMKLIFWGLLLDFLDFNLTFNGFSIDILPDFVGWLLVLFGARRMREENERFAQMQPAAGVLFAVYLLSFLLQPFGSVDLDDSLPAVALALAVDLVFFALYAYVLWQLVRAMQEMEERYGRAFGAHGIRTAVIVILVGMLLAPRVVRLPFGFALALLLLIGAFAAFLVLLVLLWRAAKTYDQLCSGSGPSDDNGEYYPGSED